MEKISIGVDSWIIQDGNYSDFAVGQQLRAALSFYSQSFDLCESRCHAATKQRPAKYQISAEVIFATDKVWVIDCGFLAYCAGPSPPFATKGAWLTSEIYLGIDPFDYKEELRKLPGMPSLDYDLVIDQIQLETTPWLTNGNEISRDETYESFRDVLKTDAWKDDDQNAHYVLECRRLAPK